MNGGQCHKIALWSVGRFENEEKFPPRSFLSGKCRKTIYILLGVRTRQLLMMLKRIYCCIFSSILGQERVNIIRGQMQRLKTNGRTCLTEDPEDTRRLEKREQTSGKWDIEKLIRPCKKVINHATSSLLYWQKNMHFIDLDNRLPSQSPRLHFAFYFPAAIPAESCCNMNMYQLIGARPAQLLLHKKGFHLYCTDFSVCVFFSSRSYVCECVCASLLHKALYGP